MDVLFINHSGAASGGAERSLFELVGKLRDRQVRPVVVLPSEGGGLAREFEQAGIPCRAAPLAILRRSGNPLTVGRGLLGLARAAPALRQAVGESGARIIHANSTTAAIYAAAAFRASPLPLVWHCRDLVNLGRMGRWLGRRASVAIAISDKVAAGLSRLIPADRLRVILNGVDPDSLAGGPGRRRTRKQWRVEPTAPVVGMAAHLVPWKNHMLFLEACARLAKVMPEARFVLAGGMPNGPVPGYLETIEACAGRLEIAASTRFLGDWGNMAAFYEAIDVLCHPTELEPFGRVVAEAMMVGRPVVAIRGSGPAEYIEDEVDGFLASPDDADGVARRLRKLLEQPDLAAAAGHAARVKAHDLLSIDRVAEEVCQLYGEILSL